MNYLTRQELAGWLDKLAQEQTLIAPIDIAGNILYRPVTDTRELVWEFDRSFMSIKEVFFPRTTFSLSLKNFAINIKYFFMTMRCLPVWVAQVSGSH